MISGLAILLLFQLAGELIVTATGLPIPGPVVGMLLLFIVCWREAVSPWAGTYCRRVDQDTIAPLRTRRNGHCRLSGPAPAGMAADHGCPDRGTALTIAATALTMRAVIAHRERKGPRSAA